MDTYEERDIYLEIAMYGDLEQRGPALVECIEQAYSQFIAPLGYSASMMGNPRGGQRNRRFVFNEKNWARFRQELLEGRLESFHLFSGYEGKKGYVTCGELEVRPLLLDDPQEPRFFSCSIKPSYYRGGFDVEVQVQWVHLAHMAFQELDGVNGYITYDWSNPWCSPYERSLGLAYQFPNMDFRHKLRGYYWGNYLSAGHITQLGGIGRIQQEAPCYLVEALSVADGGVYLQLTADVRHVSDDALAALREYLNPLLLMK